MAQGKRGVGLFDVLLRKIARQERLQHRQPQALLERTDHDEIRDMDAVIALFARLRQELRAHVVVDGRRCDGLRLPELGRQIVEILL